nr:hypothetical protein [Clostridiales bacterium]
GGARCHEVFSNIIDCLTFASDLNIEESGCSAITADRDTDALVLNGFMFIKADFCPAETSDITFASFLQKELLCGSHINDSRVHASTDEKYRWNNPFAIGNYFGDGSSHNSITLAFKPRAVIVFAADMPFTERESSSSPNLWLYAGIAAAGYGTYGVKITNNGFRADNVSTPAEGYFTVPRLNEAGQVYLYIAFR